MDDPKKVSEDLMVKIRAFLRRVASEEIKDADEPDLLSEAEVLAFTDRTLLELSLDRRAWLHAEAWVSDVAEYARQLARGAINEKLRKAASVGRSADAGREF